MSQEDEKSGGEPAPLDASDDNGGNEAEEVRALDADDEEYVPRTRETSRITSSEAHTKCKPLLSKKTVAGDTWYAIDSRWWSHFLHFAYLSEKDVTMIERDPHFDTKALEDREFPPEMDNSGLCSLEENRQFELRKGIVEHNDFVWICEELYDLCVEWFGLHKDDVKFDREVIKIGSKILFEEEQIEMYPFYVKTCVCDAKGRIDLSDEKNVLNNVNNVKIWRMSRLSTVNDLLQKCQEFYLNNISNNEDDPVVPGVPGLVGVGEDSRKARLWRKSTEEEKERMKKYAAKNKDEEGNEPTPPPDDQNDSNPANPAVAVAADAAEAGENGLDAANQVNGEGEAGWDPFQSGGAAVEVAGAAVEEAEEAAPPSYDEAMNNANNEADAPANNNNVNIMDSLDNVMKNAAGAAESVDLEENENSNSFLDDPNRFDWMLLNESDLNITFEDFAAGAASESPNGVLDMISSPYYMVETQDEWESWKRTLHWRMLLTPGSAIDCLDTALRVPKWYPAHIIEIDTEDDRVHVNYDNYAAKWNVWLERDSERIAPAHTQTAEPWGGAANNNYNNSSYYNNNNSSSNYWSGAGSYGIGGSWGGRSTGIGGYTSSWYSDTRGQPAPSSGCVGLRNLGNTCFMNSTIQCLAHCPKIVDYFLSGKYADDVNRDNPLGWQGKVADTWSGLLKKYWSDEYTVISPGKLKSTVTEVQPRFGGYQQHDSSEFLQFLLDGLHEDLNRIKKKPATDKVESEGRPDSVVAAESWATHKLRNDSIMVDVLQGQLKSRVECPDCGRVSVTFDPYMFLSVPIPSKRKEKTKLITLVRSNAVKFVLNKIKNIKNQNNSSDPNEAIEINDPNTSNTPESNEMDSEMVPTTYGVKIAALSSIFELKVKLGEMVGISPARLVLVDMFHNRIYSWFKDFASVDSIRDSDTVYAFETPSDQDLIKSQVFGNLEDQGPEQKKLKFACVQLQHKYVKPNDYTWATKKYRSDDVGMPIVVRLPIGRDIKTSLLNEYLEHAIRPYLRPEQISNFSVSDTDVTRQRDKAAALKERKDKENRENDIYRYRNDDYYNNNNNQEGAAAGAAQSLDEDDEHSSARDETQHQVPGISEINNMFGDDAEDAEDPPNLMEDDPADPVDAVANGVDQLNLESNEAEEAEETQNDVNEMNNHSNELNEDVQGSNGISNELAEFNELGAYSFIFLNKHGNNCGLCGMMSHCDGCDILSEENFVVPDSEWDSMNIGCEWRANAFDCFNHDVFAEPRNDESVPENMIRRAGAGGYYSGGTRSSGVWESMEPIGLDKCIDELTQEETLTESEAWYCRVCKEHKCAKKKFDLWKVPEIFIIHLKRFTQNGYNRDKNSTPVNYPIQGLDLSKWIVDDKAKGELYDLFAVSIHSGNLGGGHYIAFGQNLRSKEWFDYNDSSVSSLGSGEEAHTSEAYVLFYKRRDSTKKSQPNDENIDNNINTTNNNNVNEPDPNETMSTDNTDNADTAGNTNNTSNTSNTGNGNDSNETGGQTDPVVEEIDNELRKLELAEKNANDAGALPPV